MARYVYLHVVYFGLSQRKQFGATECALYIIIVTVHVVLLIVSIDEHNGILYALVVFVLYCY